MESKGDTVKKRQLIFTVVLVLHFAMVLIYTLPGNWFSYNTKRVGATYTRPFFNQRWNLFAPEIPTENYRYHVRMKNGEWLMLNDVLDETKLFLYRWEWEHALYIWAFKLDYYSHYPNTPRKKGTVKILNSIVEKENWQEVQLMKEGELIYRLIK